LDPKVSSPPLSLSLSLSSPPPPLPFPLRASPARPRPHGLACPRPSDGGSPHAPPRPGGLACGPRPRGPRAPARSCPGGPASSRPRPCSLAPPWPGVPALAPMRVHTPWRLVPVPHAPAALAPRAHARPTTLRSRAPGTRVTVLRGV
jgi:hypothetical protein